MVQVSPSVGWSGRTGKVRIHGGQRIVRDIITWVVKELSRHCSGSCQEDYQGTYCVSSQVFGLGEWNSSLKGQGRHHWNNRVVGWFFFLIFVLWSPLSPPLNVTFSFSPKNMLLSLVLLLFVLLATSLYSDFFLSFFTPSSSSPRPPLCPHCTV